MKIINANIYHSRLGPKINTFTYRANYFEFDFFENKHINEFKILSINKFNLLSVDENDYCLGEDKSLFGWVCSLCKDKSNQKIDKIKLITMPKVLGYVFNPVSFIFCYQNEEICSLILKVNNTFNESHFYYLDTKYKQNLNMEKVFHVSPFLKREGYYKVDFNNTENKFKVIRKKINNNIITQLNKHSLFILGKNKMEAIANEGALKIKEISSNSPAKIPIYYNKYDRLD